MIRNIPHVQHIDYDTVNSLVTIDICEKLKIHSVSDIKFTLEQMRVLLVFIWECSHFGSFIDFKEQKLWKYNR